MKTLSQLERATLASELRSYLHDVATAYVETMPDDILVSIVNAKDALQQFADFLPHFANASTDSTVASEALRIAEEKRDPIKTARATIADQLISKRTKQ